MKTIVCKLDKAGVEAHRDEGAQLRDDSESTLYFRYKAKDKGKGTFYYRHYADGGSRYIKLGKYPDINYTGAKAARKRTIARLANGEPVVYGETDKPLDTVADVAIWYLKRLEKEGRYSDDSLANMRSLFKKHIVARMGTVPLKGLTLVKFDECIYLPMSNEKYSLSTIQQVFIKLKAAINRADGLQLLKRHPLKGIDFKKYTAIGLKIKPGKLSTQQLPLVVKALDNASDEAAMMVCLMALFATRVGETASAGWDEFVLELGNGQWRIPAAKTKTKKNEHILPVPDVVVLMLLKYKREQQKAKRNSVWLFPQRWDKRKHISANSATRRVSLLFKRKFTAHDFRKLAATWWTESGIDYVFTKKLLNHSMKGLDLTYIQTHAKEQCMRAVVMRFDHLNNYGLFARFEQVKPLLRAA